jgi:serine/threonine protein kinase
MIGSSLSHYRITEKLGAGGMGEVYRAEDTNLDRQVAIKVLPDIFIGDPERLARFEREAKLLASLNHPNIAAIHGLEEAGGKRFLVLELVEGETLAQRIAKGPLPVDQALRYAIEIAEALDAAHRKGIVRRDLKAGNIMLTKTGAKLLDFGRAKASAAANATAATMLPTAEAPITAEGTVLGPFQSRRSRGQKAIRGRPLLSESQGKRELHFTFSGHWFNITKNPNPVKEAL